MAGLLGLRWDGSTRAGWDCVSCQDILSYFRAARRPASANWGRRGSGSSRTTRSRSVSGRGFILSVAVNYLRERRRKGAFPARWERGRCRSGWGGGGEKNISRPLGAWKLPQRVGRREKSTVRGVLPYPMGVARYRPPRTVDFSRKEVGRRCLPVGDFRTRAGATHVQAHTLTGWRPVFGIPRPGRAVSVPLAEPSVSLPVLLFALYPLRAA